MIEKIENKTAVVGIIGPGYVGPPLAIHFGRKGFDVIGFDLDTRKIDRLLHGESCIKHVPGAPIREMIAARGTSDPGRHGCRKKIVMA